ncbi:MAG: hypothetical protein DRJ31_09640 [Candidatus Methanomethylicota archaeon]|uniref:Uncharacterized protein n=1 Tax=Thermoproteota archaeon TaxID=2056631 RepID=A0A497EKE7_9CREN|nr:MAG: hypothetical protein DRJ31_09640 [Candidatus Verstraetearchaeota archaeon]
MRLLERLESKEVASGFIGGIFVGLVEVVVHLYVMLSFREEVMKELSFVTGVYGVFFDISSLYGTTLLIGSVVLFILSIIAGIFFGTIIEKVGMGLVKVVGLSLVFGLGFGLTINIPVLNRSTILFINLILWLTFSAVFCIVYNKIVR